MTISPATACCKVSAMYLKLTAVYPLSTCSMLAHSSTCGIATLVKPTSFPKPRGASNGIRSCQLCSPLVNDPLFAPYKTSFYPTRLSSPSSMACTLWCHPPSPPSLRRSSPHAPKPSPHPTQPKPNPRVERSRHFTTTLS